MNILIFVTALLMLIGILTYARVENFRSFALMEAQFDAYMGKAERDTLNKANKKFYTKTKATTKNANQKENPIKADKKIDISLLINKKKRDAKQDLLHQEILLIKNLMFYLYADRDFFKEAQQTKFNLIDEIIQEIITVTEGISEENKITEVKDISNLKLLDPVVDAAFYHMMKGTDPQKPSGKDPHKFKPDEGYYTLLDFIDLVNEGNEPIRIYLASGPVLMAIFGNPEVVSQVISAREELYGILKADKNNQLNRADIATRFRNGFVDKRIPSINPNMLNFEVSKTDPKTYK